MDIRLHTCSHCGTEGVLPTSDFKCPNCKMSLSREDAPGRNDDASANGPENEGREMNCDGTDVMPDKLVTIATFRTLIEASAVKDRLEAEGVRAVLADVAAVGMAWHLTSAFGGIKLQVMAVDAERATSLLGAENEASIGDAESWPDTTGQGIDGEEDEACEDEYESPSSELVDRAFRAALLGLLFLPLQFYSVWLLVHIPAGGEPLSPADRRRVLIAILLDTWMIVLCAVFLTTALSTAR